MGTEFLLYLDTAEMNATEERTLVQAVFAEVDRIESLCSRFQPSSEISRINRLAATGPVVTDPEIFSLLEEARSLWQQTEGAFDIALGRLSRAWGFAEKSPHLPNAEALAAARSASGMAQVKLDPEWRTVEFLAPGLELDLGAFAKGYAVDSALEVLRSNGAAALLDAGHSSLGAVGEPFRSAWPIAVQTPAQASGAAQTLACVLLHARCMGSSGIMEQKLEEAGQIFPHLFDPRSSGIGPCGPSGAARLLQVTVLAPTAALADALSTALFVLGPVDGARVLDGFPESAALWIVGEDGQTHAHRHQWPADHA